MKLTITLRRDCETLDQARSLYQAVKAKLADQPEITVGGHIVQDAEPPEIIEPPEG